MKVKRLLIALCVALSVLLMLVACDNSGNGATDKTEGEGTLSTSSASGGGTEGSVADSTDKTDAGNTDASSGESTDKTNVGNTDVSSGESTDKTNVGNTDVSSGESTDKTNVGNTDVSSGESTDESKPQHVHDFSSWEIKVKPSCTAKGSQTRFCKICGHSENQSVDALGHTTVVDPGTPPTCISKGTSDGSHCGVCMAILERPQILDEVGHTETTVEGKAPTCIETGVSDGKVCSVCGTELVSQNVLPVIAHEFDETGHCSMCLCEKPSDGVEYVISSDNLYYIAKDGSACTDTRVVIADTYKGLPVKEIGVGAFANNTTMEELVISDSVEVIKGTAFDSCTGLKRVYMGTGVKTMEKGSFDACTSLEGVYIEDLAAWCDITYAGYWEATSNPLFYAGNIYLNNELIVDLVIPREIYQIRAHAFINARCIKTVYIPSNIETIGHSAFANTEIEVFNCESSVAPITWSWAWSHSTNAQLNWNVGAQTSDTNYDYVVVDGQAYLTKYKGTEANVVVPEYIDSYPVASIGIAFYGTQITSIFIPDRVVIGTGASFTNCGKLTEIKVSDTHPLYKTINGSLYSKDGTRLIRYLSPSENGEVVIPDFVKVVGMHAFSTSTAYRKVTIPETVEIIEDRAFYKCSVKSLVFESSVPPIIGENICGYTWDNGFYVYVPSGSVESYRNVPDHWWSQALVRYDLIRSK